MEVDLRLPGFHTKILMEALCEDKELEGKIDEDYQVPGFGICSDMRYFGPIGFAAILKAIGPKINDGYLTHAVKSRAAIGHVSPGFRFWTGYPDMGDGHPDWCRNEKIALFEAPGLDEFESLYVLHKIGLTTALTSEHKDLGSLLYQGIEGKKKTTIIEDSELLDEIDVLFKLGLTKELSRTHKGLVSSIVGADHESIKSDKAYRVRSHFFDELGKSVAEPIKVVGSTALFKYEPTAREEEK